MAFKDPEKKRKWAREYYHTWRKNNPEKYKAYRDKSNKILAERRREVLEELKSVPCADCGGSFPVYVMDFDHRNPEEKIRGVANMNSVVSILREAKKCDVVCANCHRIRTWKEKYGGN